MSTPSSSIDQVSPRRRVSSPPSPRESYYDAGPHYVAGQLHRRRTIASSPYNRVVAVRSRRRVIAVRLHRRTQYTTYFTYIYHLARVFDRIKLG